MIVLINYEGPPARHVMRHVVSRTYPVDRLTPPQFVSARRILVSQAFISMAGSRSHDQSGTILACLLMPRWCGLHSAARMSRTRTGYSRCHAQGFQLGSGLSHVLRCPSHSRPLDQVNPVGEDFVTRPPGPLQLAVAVAKLLSTVAAFTTSSKTDWSNWC